MLFSRRVPQGALHCRVFVAEQILQPFLARWCTMRPCAQQRFQRDGGPQFFGVWHFNGGAKDTKRGNKKFLKNRRRKEHICQTCSATRAPPQHVTLPVFFMMIQFGSFFPHFFFVFFSQSTTDQSIFGVQIHCNKPSCKNKRE